MSTLKIVLHPDSLLRQISQPIDEKKIAAGNYRQLIEDMTQTMLLKDGVGLAAPQVGVSQRLIIVNTKQGPLAMFNPEIIKQSLIKDWDEEGCLSIPQTFGKVRRHRSIHCRFIDGDGQRRQIAAKGLLARVIQHEIDHLNGRLFIDIAKNIVQGVNTL